MNTNIQKLRIALMAFLGGLCGVCCCAQTETSVANDYINIYQKYLSGLKNTRCSMYPTCSSYAKMVFADNSFPAAMVLISDRLIRCSHDLDYYETTNQSGFSSAVDFPNGYNIPQELIQSRYTNVSAGYLHSKDSLDRVINFTSFLINQKSYTSAMLEIDKLLYFSPEAASISELYVNKLKCFEGLKQSSDGIMSYELTFPLSVKNNYRIVYTLAHLYDDIGDMDNAISQFEKAASLFDHNEVSPYGELAILYAKRSQINAAKDAIRRKYEFDGNLNAFNSCISIIEDIEISRRKNPTLARTLSIIPGCGYFYTKQPQNALAALIINGAMGYATYSSFNTKNYGLGAILGVLSLSFYLGNIVGSGTSAVRYNEKTMTDSVSQLRFNIPYIN